MKSVRTQQARRATFGVTAVLALTVLAVACGDDSTASVATPPTAPAA